jgi:hypothetical protein
MVEKGGVRGGLEWRQTLILFLYLIKGLFGRKIGRKRASLIKIMFITLFKAYN